jgi:hypothetical protein
MPRPIPSNSIRPLIAGERVQIVPEWQDPGDDEFERVVIEAPPGSPLVLIRTLIPGMEIQPAETIEASKLVRVVDFGNLADMAPETVIEEHLDELQPVFRLYLLEKFPDSFMASGRFTPEEADLCAPSRLRSAFPRFSMPDGSLMKNIPSTSLTRGYQLVTLTRDPVA